MTVDRYRAHSCALIVAAAACLGWTGAAHAATEPAGRRLESDHARFVIDSQTGGLGQVYAKDARLTVVSGVVDSYEIETRAGARKSTEAADVVHEVRTNPDGGIFLRCLNSDLPELEIHKVYRMDGPGRVVLKTVVLQNRGEKGFFIKHFTDATAGEDFRAKAFYYRPRKGNPRAIMPAAKVHEPIILGGDQAERMFVLLMAPQVGAGVAHHRHLVDGRYCIPNVGNNFALYGAWTRDGWRFLDGGVLPSAGAKAKRHMASGSQRWRRDCRTSSGTGPCRPCGKRCSTTLSRSGLAGSMSSSTGWASCGQAGPRPRTPKSSAARGSGGTLSPARSSISACEWPSSARTGGISQPAASTISISAAARLRRSISNPSVGRAGTFGRAFPACGWASTTCWPSSTPTAGSSGIIPSA